MIGVIKKKLYEICNAFIIHRIYFIEKTIYTKKHSIKLNQFPLLKAIEYIYLINYFFSRVDR